MLVAAPSNVAVDQMANKISQTGLKVCVRVDLARRVRNLCWYCVVMEIHGGM
jgi:hypothetical protein